MRPHNGAEQFGKITFVVYNYEGAGKSRSVLTTSDHAKAEARAAVGIPAPRVIEADKR